MLRTVTIVLCLTASAGAAAQVFKCVDKGKVTYSESPCPGARVTQLDLQPTSAPPAPPRDPQAELQRQKALADQLANVRHNREAQHERTREHASQQIRQRHQRCEKLRLDKSGPMTTRAMHATASSRMRCTGKRRVPRKS